MFIPVIGLVAGIFLALYMPAIDYTYSKYLALLFTLYSFFIPSRVDFSVICTLKAPPFMTGLLVCLIHFGI